VREALNRLSSEGLVERKSQRGFFVTEISMTALEELVKTRIWLETLALRESIQNATEEWEEQLVLAYHRLARTNRRMPPRPGANCPRNGSCGTRSSTCCCWIAAGPAGFWASARP
jgi:GntR family transcriptional regulator, carbon starvation induced regulator